MDPGPRALACRAIKPEGCQTAFRAAEYGHDAREERLECGHAAADDADVDLHCAALMLVMCMIEEGTK